jgi:hypothetical protein
MTRDPTVRPETRAIVEALLVAAGIRLSDDELDQIAETYPAQRAAADRLYTPEAAAYIPAVLPTDLDWREQ